jgi:hypothetical protein
MPSSHRTVTIVVFIDLPSLRQNIPARLEKVLCARKDLTPTYSPEMAPVLSVSARMWGSEMRLLNPLSPGRELDSPPARFDGKLIALGKPHLKVCRRSLRSRQDQEGRPRFGYPRAAARFSPFLH